jgi:hypothetical protein
MVIPVGKTAALLYSIAAVLILIAVGAALSYRKLWLAAALIVRYVVFVGSGFALKARARKRQK